MQFFCGKKSFMSAIALTLLHPSQSTPVQSWTFDSASVIQIGRANDSDVILYSAVVSRHHLELRYQDSDCWEIVSYGANGTYVRGKPISNIPVSDGMVIRLGESGPKIRIRLGNVDPNSLGKTISQRRSPQTNSVGLNRSKSTFLTSKAEHPAQEHPEA